MTLFNKKKNSGLNTSSTLKTSRNRLTQVVYPQTHTHIHSTKYMTNRIHCIMYVGDRGMIQGEKGNKNVYSH
jgi:hypothetical protein